MEMLSWIDSFTNFQLYVVAFFFIEIVILRLYVFFSLLKSKPLGLLSRSNQGAPDNGLGRANINIFLFQNEDSISYQTSRNYWYVVESKVWFLLFRA